MKAIFVPFPSAEKVRQWLLKRKYYDSARQPARTKKGLILPVKGLSQAELRSYPEAKPSTNRLKQKQLPKLKAEMSKILSPKEIAQLKTSHDIIGSIAILEIDKSLRGKRFAIAKAIMQLNPHIKTVLMKQGGHEGNFRTQKMGFVAGKRTKETEHRENSIKIFLNVETVYFSPRLATERIRIASLVRPGENVLVMFSGCAPYPLVIAKNAKAKIIYGVEINPAGHQYGLKSVALNRIHNIKLFRGDARKMVPRLHKRFNRVIMPLPKGGEHFLDVGIKALKPKGILHFYAFLNEKDIPAEAIRLIKAEAARQGRNVKVIRTVRCGQQQPYVYRTCTDCKIF